MGPVGTGKKGGVAMIAVMLAASALALGQTESVSNPKESARSAPPAAVDADADRQAADDADRQAASAEALARYNELREKTAHTAAAQWKLGVWCEQHGLRAEALVHFGEVVRLDPKRDAAWRKLGLRKVGHRWMTEEQIAEEAAQKKADKIWAPKVKKLHHDLHGSKNAQKRDEARAALEAIGDPRAIPSLYREFGVGGPSHQDMLIQILGQIERPLSSKVLAVLAVYGKTPEVCKRAAETLRQRLPEEYLDILVGLMIDPLKYQVRPVGGPGSPGVLFVEGRKFNRARFYATPALPPIVPGAGGRIGFDQDGLPVIIYSTSSSIPISTKGVPGSKSLVTETSRTTTQTLVLSPRRMIMEARKAAMRSEMQLENDVRSIDLVNREREQFNSRVMMLAKGASGKDLGTTPQEWRDGLAQGSSSARRASRPKPKPTVAELIPSLYNTALMPVSFMKNTSTTSRTYVDT